MTATLWSIGYSPWSRKARWALKRAGVQVRLRSFTPMVDELSLRASIGRWRGRFTLPILVDGGTIREDSAEIARFADAQRARPGWFVPEHRPEIEAWDRCSEQMLQAGRALTTRAVAADPLALRASVPPGLRSIPGVAGLLGRAGVRYLARKYNFDDPAHDMAHHEALESGLAKLADHLATRPFLVGDALTWADVSMAFALDFVKPRPDHPLDPAARPCWERPDLAARYPHLLTWRDRVIDSEG